MGSEPGSTRIRSKNSALGEMDGGVGVGGAGAVTRNISGPLSQVGRLAREVLDEMELIQEIINRLNRSVEA